MKDKDLEKTNAAFLRKIETINLRLDQATIRDKVASLRQQQNTTEKPILKRRRSNTID